MIILIHDTKLSPKAISYFKKFRDLELVYKEETDEKLKSFWKETKTIIDTAKMLIL